MIQLEGVTISKVHKKSDSKNILSPVVLGGTHKVRRHFVNPYRVHEWNRDFLRLKPGFPALNEERLLVWCCAQTHLKGVSRKNLHDLFLPYSITSLTPKQSVGYSRVSSMPFWDRVGAMKATIQDLILSLAGLLPSPQELQLQAGKSVCHCSHMVTIPGI